MKDLNKRVIPWVAKRWYDLGLELLETEYTRELDNIEANKTVAGVKICCRQMFSKWLETKSNANWGQLIQAIKNIELNSAATYIEEFIRGEYDTDL